MITKENYEKLKAQFGHVASWAIWAEEGETPKSNVGDMSVLADPDLGKLGTRFVFVGLNASEAENKNVESWSSFHSTNSRHNDYKLRYALAGTDCWGSYITDVIKGFKKTKSSEVVSHMRKHPEEMEKHIADFKQELALLSGKPILVAMGNATYDILHDHLFEEYIICKIPHYAAMVGKETYRKVVLEKINNLKEQ